MFYTILIQGLLDGTEAKMIYSFTDKLEAEKNYHYVLATNIGVDTLKYLTLVVINENGDIVDGMKRYWVAPIESVEEPQEQEGGELDA